MKFDILPPHALSRSRKGAAILASSIAALLTSQSAPAATATWLGNTSVSWNIGANWGGNVPSNGDTLLFGVPGTFGSSLTDNITALTVGAANTDGINFSLSASAYTIAPSSATITLASSGTGIGINDLSLNAQTISVPLALSSTQTINVGSRIGSLALSGLISGSNFGLTQTGSGLLTLSGPNTFTGPVTVNGGTLAFSADSASGANQLGATPGSTSAAAITLNGGTLRSTATTQLATNRGITLGSGGGAIDVNGGTLTYNGVIAGGANSFTKTGGNQLALGGVSTYTGNTNINQGTLKLDYANAVGGAITNLINSSSPLVLGGPVTGLGLLGRTFVNPTFNMTGKASTTNSQTVNGLTLNPAISAVSVTADVTANPIVLNLGAITHNPGGQVNFTNPSGTLSATNGIRTNTLNTNGIIGAYATVGGTAFATNSTNAAGGNILAYTGYTPLANAGVIGSDPTTNVQVQAAAVATSSTADGATTDVNTLSIGPAATVAHTVTVGAAGTGSTGILRLGSQGGIMVAAGATPTNSATGNVIIGNVAGNGTLTAGGALNAPGEITLSTFHALANSSNSIIINSSIKDNGTGAVTLTIGQNAASGQSSTVVQFVGTNTYTGGTFINSGRVFYSGNTAAFGAGPVTVAAGAQIFGGNLANDINIAGSGTSFADTAAAIRLNSATLSGRITLLADAAIGGGSGTLSGQITGNYNLTLGRSASGGAGTGTITVSNNSGVTPNNYTGNTLLSEGTVALGNSDVIPDGAGFGNLVLASNIANATFNLNGKSETINGLSGPATGNTGIVTTNVAGASVLTLGGNDQTTTFSGTITNTVGTLGITKIGTGTQTFSGANTYSGGTIVNGGTLLLSGAINLPATGTLQVNAGGNFSLSDGTARTTTTTAALGLASGANLTFDWNAGATDTLTSTAAATTTGIVRIIINPTNTPTGSGLTLLSSALGGLQTTGSTKYLLVNNTNYTATLAQSDTAVTIGTFSSVAAPNLFFWQGNKVAGTSAAGIDNALALSSGTASNWSTTSGAYTATGVVPGSTADVIFSTTASPEQQSTVLAADMTVKSVTFNDSTAVTISGNNALTLTSAITTAGTGTAGGGSAITVTSAAADPTISAKVILGANQTWNVASGKTLTVSGVVSGGFGLSKSGAGLLILGGDNSFTGAVSLSSGSGAIRLTSGTALGPAATSKTISLPTTLNGAIELANDITVGGKNLSMGGRSITTANAHLRNVSGDNTWNGNIALASTGGGYLVHLQAGKLTLGGTITNTANADSRNPTFLGAGDAVFNGTALDVGANWVGFSMAGTGSLTIAGAGGNKGQLIVSSGTVKVGNTTAFTSTFPLSMSGTGIVDLNGLDAAVTGLTGASTNVITSNGSGPGTDTLTVNNTTPNAYAGVLSNGATRSLALVKGGASTLTLSGTNNYTGPTNVSGGTLAISGSIGATAVNVTNGTLLLSARGAVNSASATTTLGNNTNSTQGFLTLANSLSSTTDTLANPTERFGALTLSYNSTIDFGTGSGDWLIFAGVGSHTLGTTLTILGWNGTAYTEGGTSSDRLIFAGTDSSAFAFDQADVSFNGVAGFQAIQFDANHFEIVAIPEPSSTALLGALGLVGLVGYRERRRLGKSERVYTVRVGKRGTLLDRDFAAQI